MRCWINGAYESDCAVAIASFCLRCLKSDTECKCPPPEKKPESPPPEKKPEKEYTKRSDIFLPAEFSSDLPAEFSSNRRPPRANGLPPLVRPRKIGEVYPGQTVYHSNPYGAKRMEPYMVLKVSNYNYIHIKRADVVKMVSLFELMIEAVRF